LKVAAVWKGISISSLRRETFILWIEDARKNAHHQGQGDRAGGKTKRWKGQKRKGGQISTVAKRGGKGGELSTKEKRRRGGWWGGGGGGGGWVGLGLWVGGVVCGGRGWERPEAAVSYEKKKKETTYVVGGRR